LPIGAPPDGAAAKGIGAIALAVCAALATAGLELPNAVVTMCSCAGDSGPWDACDSGGGGGGGDGANGAEVSSRFEDLTRTLAVCIAHRCKVSTPTNTSLSASCMIASALLAKNFMALSKPERAAVPDWKMICLPGYLCYVPSGLCDDADLQGHRQ